MQPSRAPRLAPRMRLRLRAISASAGCRCTPAVESEHDVPATGSTARRRPRQPHQPHRGAAGCGSSPEMSNTPASSPCGSRSARAAAQKTRCGRGSARSRRPRHRRALEQRGADAVGARLASSQRAPRLQRNTLRTVHEGRIAQAVDDHAVQAGEDHHAARRADLVEHVLHHAARQIEQGGLLWLRDSSSWPRPATSTACASRARIQAQSRQRDRPAQDQRYTSSSATRRG